MTFLEHRRVCTGWTLLYMSPIFLWPLRACLFKQFRSLVTSFGLMKISSQYIASPGPIKGSVEGPEARRRLVCVVALLR